LTPLTFSRTPKISRSLDMLRQCLSGGHIDSNGTRLTGWSCPQPSSQYSSRSIRRPAYYLSDSVWIFQLAKVFVVCARLCCCRALGAVCCKLTHLTMSSAMFRANFPTLVPPNFCTTQERWPLSFCGALENMEGALSCPLVVPVALILQRVRVQPDGGGRRGIVVLQSEREDAGKHFSRALTISADLAAKRDDKIWGGCIEG
jgi:hypothetical protein